MKPNFTVEEKCSLDPTKLDVGDMLWHGTDLELCVVIEVANQYHILSLEDGYKFQSRDSISEFDLGNYCIPYAVDISVKL